MKTFLRLLVTFMLLLSSVAVIVTGFYYLSTSSSGKKAEADPVEVTATEKLEQSTLSDTSGVTSSGGTVTGD